MTLTALLVTALCSIAQAQVSFGVKTGLNLAQESFQNFGIAAPDVKLTPSFMVGGIVEFGFTDLLALQTGLEFTGKGFAYDDGSGATYNPFYLQVPVHLKFQYNGFIASAGPYVGMGVLGSYDNRLTGINNVEISYGNDISDDYTRLDYGIGVRLGYQLPFGLFFITSYELGLANNLPKDYRDTYDGKTSHQVLGVAIGYMFGQAGKD